jgi:hypothetical protein
MPDTEPTPLACADGLEFVKKFILKHGDRPTFGEDERIVTIEAAARHLRAYAELQADLEFMKRQKNRAAIARPHYENSLINPDDVQRSSIAGAHCGCLFDWDTHDLIRECMFHADARGAPK